MTVVTKNIPSFSCDLPITDLAISEVVKQKAIDTVRNLPLPTTRDEFWKYTRVAKLGKIDFVSAHSAIESISPYLIDDTKNTFVFINGFYSEDLSSTEIQNGLTIKLLSQCSNEELTGGNLLRENDIFDAINIAHTTDGLLVKIDDRVILDKPIQILHILSGENTISNFKTIVRLGKSSEASIVEGFFSENGNSSFCNSFADIVVAENAHLKIDKIQFEEENAYHISSEYVKQEKNSSFSINTITLNGGLVRNNLNIAVEGENCMTALNGAYLLKGKQHVDNHTVIDHKVPNCESHELYKGVIDENGTAVFNGKVFVRPNAQKINAFQSNANVLLSDNATINSKPELEIYADDVKCSHGSTTGQLDEEAVFYLRARGVSELKARHLMVSAFIEDVLGKIENEQVHEFVHKLLKQRFNWEF